MNTYGSICCVSVIFQLLFHCDLVWQHEVVFQMYAYNKVFQNDTIFQNVDENNYFLHAVT